jgi:hypothetical protein
LASTAFCFFILTPSDRHEKEMNLEELQSNGAFEARVLGLVHNSHLPAAEALKNLAPHFASRRFSSG